jgi:thiamine-phosphate pyrophosphorylase
LDADVTVAASPTPLRTDRLARLADSRLYLCTDGRRDRADLVPFLDAVLAGGVDVVQLREKGLEAADELALLDVFADACRRHGALLAVNDRADLAHAAGADVLHLGQRDLPPAAARALLGRDIVIGRSSNAPDLTAAAAHDADVDYACIGPAWATPTKPGRAAAGLSAVRSVADRATAEGWAMPWFAIGGIDAGNLDQVLAAGATRLVVVRALTEADDPGAAAALFADRLRP